MLPSLSRTYPPSSLACRNVSQNGETYFEAESRKTSTPLYGFLLTRLRGNPAEVHGLRQGITPASSRLRIFSLTMAYASIFLISKVMLEVLKESRLRGCPRMGRLLKTGYRRTPRSLPQRCHSDFRACGGARRRSQFDSG